MFSDFSAAYRERSRSFSTSEHFLAFVWVQATRKQTYIWAQSIEANGPSLSGHLQDITPPIARFTSAEDGRWSDWSSSSLRGSETVTWAWAIDSQATPRSNLTLIK
ncbi:hypothetical protein JAAARDRAFT_509637 [Jaapia argillacea MUCL 33604]|uniref:Uncharacterized protein n=1 Tax=Jaapia argillacea MUCL 33604 TaxID=933084 RepID=A0A067Q5M9_9AGAM|nr:hypothetical protein JAAARDRAFT_509637 [Jaapia argillacea MUCL 33604]